jgi:hypothetical protein
MKKSTAILLSTMVFFLGIVLGFLVAPIKNGISIGNNNGNKYQKTVESESGRENDFNF